MYSNKHFILAAILMYLRIVNSWNTVFIYTIAVEHTLT